MLAAHAAFYTTRSPRSPPTIDWIASAARIRPMMPLTTLAPVSPSTRLKYGSRHHAAVRNRQHKYQNCSRGDAIADIMTGVVGQKHDSN